jgi:hypothetical protein
MRSRGKSKFLALLFTFLWAATAAGDPPIERDFLKLPDGRWIWLEKIDWERTRVILGRGAKREQSAIWSENYESNDDRSWAYAYFVHLKPGKLAYDLDGDGRLEVGVATYDLGLLMIRKILIFTIEKNRLTFLREQGPYNMAADESVF